MRVAFLISMGVVQTRNAPILSEMVCKRVRGWILGRNLHGENLAEVTSRAIFAAKIVLKNSRKKRKG